jgi:hypothetical protein
MAKKRKAVHKDTRQNRTFKACAGAIRHPSHILTALSRRSHEHQQPFRGTRRRPPFCSRPIVLFFPPPTGRRGRARDPAQGGLWRPALQHHFWRLLLPPQHHGLRPRPLRHVHPQQAHTPSPPLHRNSSVVICSDRTHCPHTHRTAPHLLTMKTAAIFALLACAANAFVLPTPKLSQVCSKIRGREKEGPTKCILALALARTCLRTAGTFSESSACMCWASLRPLFSFRKRPPAFV